MHAPVKRALVSGISQVFQENKYADQVLQNIFRENKKFGSRDRRGLAEAYYEIVRHYRLLEASVGSSDPEAILNRYLECGSDLPKQDDPKLQYSISNEFFERFQQERPGDHLEVIRALNEPANVYLRSNPLKATRDEVIAALAKEDVEAFAVDDIEHALQLKTRKKITTTKAYLDGLFEVQDLGSQMIVPFMEVQPGDHVVDACAGAGGKTLQLAAILKGEGELLAMDVDEARLFEMKRRCKRAGAKFVQVAVIEDKNLLRLTQRATHVLLDAPCSGSGTLRRKPDIKYKLTNADIDGYYRPLQKQILSKYSEMVAPGFILVYATCSVFPSENQLQVREFLEASEGKFELLSEREVLPTEFNTDGFYMAKLLKKD